MIRRLKMGRLHRAQLRTNVNKETTNALVSVSMTLFNSKRFKQYKLHNATVQYDCVTVLNTILILSFIHAWVSHKALRGNGVQYCPLRDTVLRRNLAQFHDNFMRLLIKLRESVRYRFSSFVVMPRLTSLYHWQCFVKMSTKLANTKRKRNGMFRWR